MMMKIAVLMLAICAAASAQKSNGYVFFGLGGIASSLKPGNLGHFGGGLDWGLAKGVAANLEAGALYGAVYEGAGFGLVSPGISYHPLLWKDPKVDPFVGGGYTFMGNSHGNGSLFYFGGGMKYWMSERKALLVEFRDHVGDHAVVLWTATGSVHLWEIRVGLAFR
jgi:hypothetical protein